MIREDLAGPPDEVAVALLGCRLVAGDVIARLVDLEAYGGPDDPASHAYRGPTERNRTMFGPPGHLYVYLSYGIHNCMNVVCGPPGTAWAVLVRGVEIEAGAELVRARRGRKDPRGRLDGPGRCCQGLGIARSADGVDLFDPAGPVRLAPGATLPGERCAAGPRVGISKERERPWRFRLVQVRAGGAP